MIDVSIAAGDSVQQNVVMSDYRSVHRPRFGVVGEINRWKADRSGTSGSDSDSGSDSKIGFGAGVIGHFPLRERVALQLSVRYGRVGEQTSYQGDSEIPDGEGDVTFQYLTPALLFQHFPWRTFRLGITYGFEVPYLLSAQFSSDEYGGSYDVTDDFNSFQISLDLGAVFELSVGSHLLQFSLIYGLGMLGLDNSDERVAEEVKPRELRLGVNFLL
jgi:hypothetical protein